MDDEAISAGRLSDFVAGFRRTMEHGATSSVPCGGCTACCRIAHFVQIEPDETDTLAHIPPELLAPAVGGRSDATLTLGYDSDGRCPMLSEQGCRIWEHRPQVCRTYDCRVYPATGLPAEQPPVAERVRRWRFTADDPGAETAAASVKAAAASLTEHFPESPASARAAAAVALADMFADGVPAGLDRDTLAGEIRRRFGQTP